MNIANQLFPAFRTDLNAALTALASHFQGNSAPSVPVQGLIWLDTSTSPYGVKQYDGAQWILLGVLDATNNLYTPAGSISGNLYAASSGTDTIALTLPYPFASYTAGLTLAFKAGGTNTGAATMNVNTLGAKAIKRPGGAVALSAGEITAGSIYLLIYDAVQDCFQLLNSSSGAGAASESTSGAIALATQAEVYDGDNDTDAVTPRKLSSLVGGDWAVVASVASPNIETPNRRLVEITGDINVTSFVAPSVVGIPRLIVFSGTLTLSHSAGLLLPGGQNLSIVPGDILEVVSVSTGWKTVNWLPASGLLGINSLVEDTTPDYTLDFLGTYDASGATHKRVALYRAGRVVQRVYDEERTYSNNTGYTQIPSDDTRPEITEGVEILSVAITPTSASNRIRARAVVPYGPNIGLTMIASIHRGGPALASSWQYSNGGQWSMTNTVEVEEVSPGTSSVTYSVRVGATTIAAGFEMGAWGANGSRRLGGAACASLVVEEIVP
jgi:hypothetical protein